MMMDPERLEAAVTDRTRAVVPVHLNGFPCDLDAIRAICRRHDLDLIEDCAQAIGTHHRGEPVGRTDLGAFSLHPLKVLSACGDAGFVTAQTDEEARKLRELRNNGHESRDRVRWISRNSRLDTLQAAILLVKIDHLEDWIEARRRHARAYREALPDELVMPPEETDGDRSIYSMFVVRHPQRDALHRRLRQRGIDVKIHYPLGIHQQEPFQRFAPPELPVTERVVSRILSLPVSPELQADQRDRIVAALTEELESL
ncbi:MAG: DegT/DnrJ/EryC1/StrS family aminotransferase, partial [Bradymonadaceae bacterium]